MDENSAPSPTPDNLEKKENILKSLISKFKNFSKRKPSKKHLAVVSGISLGVLVFGVGALQFYGPKAAEPNPEPQIESTYVAPPPEPTTVASRLTGVQVEPALNERAVTGIMIENSIDARPQAGLVDAGVVFEAIAEGGITRFLALYQEAQPDHLGPIRSARPYYVQWARGFDAAYAHSGGSGEALALIPAIGVKDLDHGRHSGSFDRVSNRFAPHNVYTSMARLDSLRASLGYTASDFTGFERLAPPVVTEEAEVDAEPTVPAAPVVEKANTISFDISSHNYNTSYTYNPETNKYARVMAGKPHVDERSGAQIQPSVVIAAVMSFGIHPDRIHSAYGNIGSGEATIYQHGEVLRGKWSKPNATAELKFTTTAGEPLELQPGQTWITAIPAGRFSHAL